MCNMTTIIPWKYHNDMNLKRGLSKTGRGAMRNIFALSVILAVTFYAFTTTAKDDEASVRFKKGVQLFNEGKNEEAVVEFQAAYDAKPSWKIMYNIGQCNASLKRYGMAIEAFEKYLAEGGDEVPPERQDEVLAQLGKLRQMVGYLNVKGEEGVEVYINKVLRGATPLSGSIIETAGIEHMIWLVKDGKKLLTVKRTLRGGEIVELTVPSDDSKTSSPTTTSEPTPPVTGPTADDSSTVASTDNPPDNSETTTKDEPKEPVTKDEGKKLKPVLFIVGTAVAVAFGGAAGGLAVAINSKWEKSAKSINDNPWIVDTKAVSANIRTMQILGYASLGLSAAGLITAIVAIPLTNWKKQESVSSSLKLRLLADGKNSGLCLEGRF